MAKKQTRELSRHSENKWVILAVLAVAQFMVVLDVAIVNIALPTIFRELHFAPNNLQWVITAYTLTFGGFLLLGGRASDIFGRRKIFIGSVLAFSTLSLLCGLAASPDQLIFARAAQGLAGAIMSPAALSIVLAEFKEGKERNTALGIWAAVAASGAAVGVLIGGVLTQYAGWRWNFFVNVPVGVIVAIFAFRLIPHHIGEENKKIKLDLPGALLATSGLMSLVYGLSKAPTLSWSSNEVWGFIILGIALLFGFVINEMKVKQPLVPLRIFRIRNVAGGNAAFLVVACTLFSMFFFLTLYTQQVLGYSQVKAGLAFIPMPIVVGITSQIVAKLVNKIGYKPPIMLGPLVLTAGLYILHATMKVGGVYWQNVFPGFAVFALGMGLIFVSGTLAATSGVPKHFAGLASGILNTSQQVGGSIGLAILSAVAFTSVKNNLFQHKTPLVAQVNGYKSAIFVAMGLSLAAFVVVSLLIKNNKVDAKKAFTGGA